MKRLVISTLSALAFSSLVAPAFASEVTHSNTVNEINPFNLITASYQGRFVKQGIPSYSSFLSAIRADRIEAEDLVKSAIAAGRLSEDTLQDTKYLNSVEVLLDDLDRN